MSGDRAPTLMAVSRRIEGHALRVCYGGCSPDGTPDHRPTLSFPAPHTHPGVLLWLEASEPCPQCGCGWAERQSQSPICAQQLNQCPIGSPPFTGRGGKGAGLWQRPSRRRQASPSADSELPSHLPHPAFSQKGSQYSILVSPLKGPSPCHFTPYFQPSLASEEFSRLANKIKTYLPLTVLIHSTDLLLLLGCYKTDARAATLISIHLLTARE